MNDLTYKNNITENHDIVNHKNKIGLTGDTVITVADGRHNVSIAELAESGSETPVFCSIGKKYSVYMIKPPVLVEKQPVYKILLDDGSIIKTIDNSKFKLTNNELKTVNQLNSGDSLAIHSKFHATRDDIFKHKKRKVQDYMWFKTSSSPLAEHTLIASFHQNFELKKGYVVHHIDFNGLNNKPENLKIMTVKDHDAYHASLMCGDNNPMRRAQTEWSEEKWQQYSENMSKAIGGEKNGRYKGNTDKEIFNHALVLTKKLGRRFSSKEWIDYARENDIIKSFTEFRKYKTQYELSVAAALELNLDEKLIYNDPRTIETYFKMLDDGYDADIEDGKVIIELRCINCNCIMRTEHSNRHKKYCSNGCVGISCRQENIKKLEKGRNVRLKQKEERKIQQVQIYNDLKFELKREPWKNEWENACKDKNIPIRFGPTSPFSTYKSLQQYAKDFNHKVVSVKFAGYEDVYEISLSDGQNILIGGFETVSEYNKPKWHYVNVA